jgi:hypothetical protein
MDFLNARIGVEVSFNHAEAIPWTFTRLNLAGESDRVLPEHQIDVGVAFFATETLKRWSRMDSAVGTFEIACAWLSMMSQSCRYRYWWSALTPKGGLQQMCSAERGKGPVPRSCGALAHPRWTRRHDSRARPPERCPS